MRLLARLTLTLALCCLVRVLPAADIPFTFAREAQRVQYEGLVQELRCLVCQNQNLADSHADLAQDLRNEVYRMVLEGRDNASIIAFLVGRYGDFVRYRPPVKESTWLLWFGPFALLALSLIIWWRVARVRAPAASDLSPEERARLAALVQSNSQEDP